VFTEPRYPPRMDTSPPSSSTDPRVGIAVKEREFTLTRWFDAPRERVWRAWTDPQELAAWWGPHGYTNPVVEADMRPGGRLRIVMRSPDGVDFPAVGEFLAVEPPSRLVFTDDVGDEAPAEWRASLDEKRPSSPPGSPLRIVVEVTLEERDGGTLLTVTDTFASDEDRDAIMRDGAVEGWSESMERLEALVTAA
jgi:uncharacterized protein YndB with AHSA1/START domain